ncbi:MAG: hypothetical protein Greene041619_504 [Candidatus Peregrinibacteria bacterium Greene0416_19]|nr:MAG: hypothetical protein Greene041619_504 [Candidatus Peregrinibacteria bacterium Greene0416_19]
MIPKFPRMSSREVVTLLHEHGFHDARQRGSHLILIHPESGKHVVVPVGKKDLPIGTAKAIFRAAGIDVS